MHTPARGRRMSPTLRAAGKQLQGPQPSLSFRTGNLPQTGAHQLYSLGILRMGTLRMGTPLWHLQHCHSQLCPSQELMPGFHVTGSPHRGWEQPPAHPTGMHRGDTQHPPVIWRAERVVVSEQGAKSHLWQRNMACARLVPVLGTGLSWEQTWVAFPTSLTALQRGSPCMMPCCEAQGLFPRGIPTCDMPPHRPAEGGWPGPGGWQ